MNRSSKAKQPTKFQRNKPIPKNMSNNNITPPLKISFPALNIRKEFWSGPEGEANPPDELKELRKSCGINVKGNFLQLSPPPLVEFHQLDPATNSQILQALSHYSIKTPSSIQMQALPTILSGCDILGIAPTGSGKTLAYALPMIPHILHQINSNIRKQMKPNVKSKNLIALIIVPTRELCLQVEMTLKPFKKLFGIYSCSFYGGTDKDTQMQLFNSLLGGCHVVVATPGRLLDCIQSKLIDLSYVTYLVLDEADRMLSLGFEEQLNTILGYIRPDRQTVLFSASFPGRLREVASSSWMRHNETIIRCNTVEVTVTAPKETKKIISTENETNKGSNDDGESKRKDMSNDDETTVTRPTKKSKTEQLSSDENETLCSNNNNKVDNEIDEDEDDDDNNNNSNDDDEIINNSSEAVDTQLSSVAISSTITQHVHICASHKKPRLLIHYLEKVKVIEKELNLRQSSGILIFCNKIKTVQFVADFLKRQQNESATNSNNNNNSSSSSNSKNKNKNAASGGSRSGNSNNSNINSFAMLHGSQPQSQREATLRDFKAGKINILISTDVCARGLHVKRLRYVINYDFPGSIEQYAHRIGRVGRQGVSGEAYSLITRNMAALVPALVKLLKMYQQVIEPNLMALAEETVALKQVGDEGRGSDGEEEDNQNEGDEENNGNDDEDSEED